MDLNAIREGIVVCETIFEGSVEQPVDLDIVLPDYCPDITRILKCVLLPQIGLKQILGDRLNVEGTALLRLIYVSDSGTVRAYENAVPFSNSFNLKSNPEDCLIDVGANVEYVNCRATSQRRLDIHAAFAISARLTAKSKNEVTCGLEGDTVEMKMRSLPYDTVIATEQLPFSVTEMMEISEDKPAVKQVLRSSGNLIMTDHKTIANKLIIKADAVFKVVYLTDTESEAIESMEYTVPTSQIIDVPGVGESTECDVLLDVLSASIAPDADALGDTGQFKADIKAVATVRAFERMEVPVLLDAYSTKGELSPSFKNQSFQNYAGSIGENHICKGSLPLKDTGVESVVDIWFECLKGMPATYENGQLLISGKINVFILALDSEGEYLYLERTAEYDYAKPMPAEDNLYCQDTRAVPVSIGYRMNTSGELEIQAELHISTSLYTNRQVECIESASLNEEAETGKENLPGLVIYFADEGEELWDIAREHSTCVKAIQEENNLTSEVMEHKDMLMLPV